MDCKNKRKRTHKKRAYLYCSLLKKEITFDECRCCKNKEYKQYNPMKKRSSKQAKKEKDRYSIIYSDLTKCCVQECGSNFNVQKNEVFEGAYRNLSIKHGMVCPFCKNCHDRFHSDLIFNLEYKALFQKEYLKNHSLNEFIAIFKQDFIYKLEKLKAKQL